MEAAWNWLNQHYQAISVVIGIVAVSLTAIFAAVEYRAENARNKVERSIVFANQYRSGRLILAREELQTLFDDLFPEERRDPRTADATRRARNKVLKSLRSGRNSINYGIVIEFFNAAYKCIELDACDAKTLDELLSYDACSFLAQYYWKIDIQTKSEKEFTQGIRYFSSKYRQGECGI